MPRFVVTYDLRQSAPKPHAKFLEFATEAGWATWVRGGGKWHKLPNTTLEGQFDTIEDALAAFDTAVRLTEAELGVTKILEKIFIVSHETGRIRSNVKKPI